VLKPYIALVLSFSAYISANFTLSSGVSFFCSAFYVIHPHKRHRIAHNSKSLILKTIATMPRSFTQIQTDDGERLTLVTRWSSDIIPAVKCNSGLPLTRQMPVSTKIRPRNNFDYSFIKRATRNKYRMTQIATMIRNDICFL